MKFLLVLLLLSLNSFAFEPVYKETQKFKIKVGKRWSHNSKFCKFETRFDYENNQIQIRAGIVGSPVDFFGWNAPLDPKDFPLRSDFKKIYAVPGSSSMVLTYDGKTLRFKLESGEEVWNRLYPFSIEIDPNLQNPKYFSATMEGFETSSFGKPKKHIIQKCWF